MDLSSRWDRCAGLFILLVAVVAMPGCQGLLGGSSSQSGTLSASSATLDFGTTVLHIYDKLGVSNRVELVLYALPPRGAQRTSFLPSPLARTTQVDVDCLDPNQVNLLGALRARHGLEFRKAQMGRTWGKA